jgi:hypothetical protein
MYRSLEPVRVNGAETSPASTRAQEHHPWTAQPLTQSLANSATHSTLVSIITRELGTPDCGRRSTAWDPERDDPNAARPRGWHGARALRFGRAPSRGTTKVRCK